MHKCTEKDVFPAAALALKCLQLVSGRDARPLRRRREGYADHTHPERGSAGGGNRAEG